MNFLKKKKGSDSQRFASSALPLKNVDKEKSGEVRVEGARDLLHGLFQGNTPLHFAISHGDLSLVCFLLLKGADPLAVNESGLTCLDLCIMSRDTVMEQVLLKHTHCNKLVEGKKSVDVVIRGVRSTRTHSAPPIYSNSSTLFTESLLLYDAAYLNVEMNSNELYDFSCCDDEGNNALMKASYQGHVVFVEFLVRKMPSTRATNHNGFHAVTWAAYRGHVAVIDILLDSDSDVLRVLDEDINKVTPLMAAVLGNRIESVKLLIQRGANVDRTVPNGVTPLVVATWKGFFDIVRLLWQNGARSGHSDKDWKYKGFDSLKFYDQPKQLGTFAFDSIDRFHYRILYSLPHFRKRIDDCFEFMSVGSEDLRNSVVRSSQSSMSKSTNITNSVSKIVKRRSRTRFKETVSLEQLSSYGTEATLIIDSHVVYGTELNKSFVQVIQHAIQLIIAVNAESKVHYVAISLLVIHSVNEVLRLIQQNSIGVLYKNSVLELKQVNVAKEIQNSIQRLNVVTRLASGVWPPPNAISDFVAETVLLVKTTRDIVDLGNASGRWKCSLVSLELGKIKPFSNESGESTENLNIKMDFEEYKRQQKVNEIQQIAFSDSKETASEGENDAVFLARLDTLTSQFVQSIYQLKYLKQMGYKQQFVNATQSVLANMDALVDEIKNYEVLQDIPSDALLDGTIFIRSTLKELIEFIPVEGEKVMLCSKLAAGVWPPADAMQNMIAATVPCVLAVKKLLSHVTAACPVVRGLQTEVRRKKDKWLRERMNNEQVKNLFLLYEKQASVERIAIDSSIDGLLKDSAEGLLFELKDGKKIIKAGKLARLIDHLSSHEAIDADYQNSFLLSFFSFTTSHTLMDLIVKRYSIVPPFGLNQAQFDVYLKQKVIPVRLRVVCILSTWIEKYPGDFRDVKLLTRMVDLLNTKVSVDFPHPAAQLISSVTSKVRQIVNSKLSTKNVKGASMVSSDKWPKPILPKNNPELSKFCKSNPSDIFEIDSLEIARQLTLIDSEMYKKVGAREFLYQIWGQHLNTLGDKSMNVYEMINMTNKLTKWVAEMILDCDTLKTRANRLLFFSKVAISLREVQNFNSLTAIVAALSMGPIRRLYQTWNHSRIHDSFKELVDLVSPKGQYANYRRTIRSIESALVPFLGVYLTDLTFVEVGNPDFMNDGLINFEKRRKACAVISEIQTFQLRTFHFHAVEPLRDYFLQSINAIASKSNEQVLYEKSKHYEPPVPESEEEE